MEEIKKEARQNYIPIVREETAKKLCEFCRDKKAKRILEIGTAIGYSGSLLLKSCDGHLTTIEKDETRANQAIENFRRLNLLGRVTLYVDDALKVLKELESQGQTYDFIFLDGAKGQYKNYYPILKNLLEKDGVLFCDNMNLLGLVKSEGKIPHKHRSMVEHLRQFIETLKEDKNMSTTFYDIDDGFSVSVKLN